MTVLSSDSMKNATETMLAMTIGLRAAAPLACGKFIGRMFQRTACRIDGAHVTLCQRQTPARGRRRTGLWSQNGNEGLRGVSLKARQSSP
jgi:hypothetical protein